jgi:lactate dehydrogenase-like 2-hydroxyacid dehydrogenase
LTTHKPRALYYETLAYQPDNLALLYNSFDVTSLPDPRSDSDDLLAETEVLFAPLGFTIDFDKIARCPILTTIVSNTTGVAHIDMEAASKAGVTVCALHDEQDFLDTVTPTAEHTIGLMLSAWRRVPAAHQAAREGAWNRWPWGAPRMMSRMRLGIVGRGRLGRKVETIAQAMGMQTHFFDPGQSGSVSSMLELAKNSDILTLHAPANESTHHIVSREILEALPPQAMVVNTARGELLDTDALIDLMENGHLWAAALDTIEGEYDPQFTEYFSDSRIASYARSHNNLVLTPHIGGSTIDAWSETQRRVLDKAISASGARSAGRKEHSK